MTAYSKTLCMTLLLFNTISLPLLMSRRYSHDNPRVVLHNGIVEVESPEVHDGCALHRWDTRCSGVFMFWCHTLLIDINARTYHDGLGHSRLKGVAEIQEPLLVVSEEHVLLVPLHEHGLAHARLSGAEAGEGEAKAPFNRLNVCLRAAHLPAF